MQHYTWVYHAIESPKLVPSPEAKSYYAQGWADTPAAFKTEGEDNGKSTNEVTSEITNETREILPRKGRKRVLSK